MFFEIKDEISVLPVFNLLVFLFQTMFQILTATSQNLRFV